MLKEGQILENKYKVGRLLGQGGMGAVFLGEHTLIKRAVAIKVLHDVDPKSENARRFEKEAQAAGQIGSDHIVEVLDLGTTPDGERFMVMEYLDGESLKARLARGRLQPAEIVPIVTQVLEGLAAAHAAGIVHRDLKPDNVFILKEKAGRRDFVKIVDFGISKFGALGAEGGMTKTGAVMGTPYYMSPEQARASNEVDNRSDLYAVGVLLFEAVTGAVPFNGTTFTELLFKIVFEEAPHPSAFVPDLDPEFAAIVLKAMARDPNARYPTASALREALMSWRERPRPMTAAMPLGLPPSASATSPRPPAAGTAILDAGSNPFASSPSHALPYAPQQPIASGTAILEAGSNPFASSPPQALPYAPQQPHLGQSVSSGSQVLDAPRAAPKSQTGVLVGVALLLALAIGGATAFFVTRPAEATSGLAASAAIDVPPPPATATAAAPSAAPSSETASLASATPSSEPSSIASAKPTSEPASIATPIRRHIPAAAPPPPTSKPSATPSSPAGKLKDLGY